MDKLTSTPKQLACDLDLLSAIGATADIATEGDENPNSNAKDQIGLQARYHDLSWQSIEPDTGGDMVTDNLPTVFSLAYHK